MNELLDAAATMTMTMEAGIRNGGLLRYGRAGFEPVEEVDHLRRTEEVAVVGFPVEDQSGGDPHRFEEVTCPADPDTVIEEHPMPGSH